MADVAVWRPSNGYWSSLRSTTGASHTYAWGTFGDSAIPADYDGDGQTDRAVFRPVWVDGENTLYNVWVIEPSSTINPTIPPGSNLRAEVFGLDTDLRLPYDYDGDGQTDLAVYRGETATWYIQQTTTKTLRSQQLGEPGLSKALPGDYDGDHKTDLAVLERGETPVLKILRSSDNTQQTVPFDTFNSNPVIKDYDGDGKVDLTTVQLENNLLVWRILQSSNGMLLTITFGQLGDAGVPADYDGDGKMDVAVWRAADQTWYILQSSDGQIHAHQLGAVGDVLVPAAVR